MSVTESASGRAARGGYGAGRGMRLTRSGRSRPRAQARYFSPLPSRGLPALARDRGEPLQKPRGHRRRAGELAGRGENHLARAKRLGEVVRRERDAPLRQIESERVAHRAAEPGIAARLRRPRALDQAAEHDAVDVLQARLERAVDAHARARQFRPAHHAVADDGVEQLDVIRERDGKTSGRAGQRDLLEAAASAAPSAPTKAAIAPVGTFRSRAITSAWRAASSLKGCGRARAVFQRRERSDQPRDQVRGVIKIALGQGRARIGRMQI